MICTPRLRLLVTITAAAVALGAAGAQAQVPMVMKIATVNSGDNPRNQAAEELARQLGEKSKGRIKGEVYINNQLARGEGATLEGIQLGTIDFAPVGSAPIGGNFQPPF